MIVSADARVAVLGDTRAPAPGPKAPTSTAASAATSVTASAAGTALRFTIFSLLLLVLSPRASHAWTASAAAVVTSGSIVLTRRRRPRGVTARCKAAKAKFAANDSAATAIEAAITPLRK